MRHHELRHNLPMRQLPLIVWAIRIWKSIRVAAAALASHNRAALAVLSAQVPAVAAYEA